MSFRPRFIPGLKMQWWDFCKSGLTVSKHPSIQTQLEVGVVGGGEVGGVGRGGRCGRRMRRNLGGGEERVWSYMIVYDWPIFMVISTFLVTYIQLKQMIGSSKGNFSNL